jgi:hypothetical protein
MGCLGVVGEIESGFGSGSKIGLAGDLTAPWGLVDTHQDGAALEIAGG